MSDIEGRVRELEINHAVVEERTKEIRAAVSAIKSDSQKVVDSVASMKGEVRAAVSDAIKTCASGHSDWIGKVEGRSESNADRLTKIERKNGEAVAEKRGMTNLAKILWGLFGTSILTGIGTFIFFAVKLYVKMNDQVPG